jgi:hypothetical protein
MKRAFVSFFLLFSALILNAQTAKFYAKKLTFAKGASIENTRLEKAMEMQWLINGKLLRFGEDTIEVVPNKNKLDTIYFKRDTKMEWDTIICNIAEPKVYELVYNDCYGVFEVYSTKKRIPMKVEVAIKGKSNKMFLARLEETGKVINGSGELSITPLCRSAMKPYIFWIMLQQVEVCTDTGNCEKNEEFCIQKENGERDYSFSYTVTKTITKFLFMPLTDKPLRVSYKPEKNKLKIK